jgi:hypothetical protein
MLRAPRVDGAVEALIVDGNRIVGRIVGRRPAGLDDPTRICRR